MTTVFTFTVCAQDSHFWTGGSRDHLLGRLDGDRSPLHQSPVLLGILPGAEGVGNQRSGLLLVDGDGYLQGPVHVVVLVEVKRRGQFLEGADGNAPLLLSHSSTATSCRYTHTCTQRMNKASCAMPPE